MRGEDKLSWAYADNAANDHQERDRVVDRAVARIFAARARQEAVGRNRHGDSRRRPPPRRGDGPPDPRLRRPRRRAAGDPRRARGRGGGSSRSRCARWSASKLMYAQSFYAMRSRMKRTGRPARCRTSTAAERCSGCLCRIRCPARLRRSRDPRPSLTGGTKGRRAAIGVQSSRRGTSLDAPADTPVRLPLPGCPPDPPGSGDGTERRTAVENAAREHAVGPVAGEWPNGKAPDSGSGD